LREAVHTTGDIARRRDRFAVLGTSIARAAPFGSPPRPTPAIGPEPAIGPIVAAMSEPAPPSAFEPFRHRAFAVLWTATLVSNTGTWLRDVANGWSMTEMSPSPTLVALVQTATTLPIFLFSLPAGALADLVDRRRMLIAIQLLLALVAGALATAAMQGFTTPGLLLALTFTAGVGSALMGPPWQSIVPELVPRPILRQAVALNALGINVARALGPAVGGAIVASAGVVPAYGLDALSYLAIIGALVWWRRVEPKAALSPERFAPAMRTGLRFAAASSDLRRVLVRAVAFFLFGSAYWALLPLYVRQVIGGDAAQYGALLTAVGAGAIAGALLLPRLAGGVESGRLVAGGTFLTAAAMAGLAMGRGPWAAGFSLFAAGAAWITVLTTLNVSAQTVLPNWVRARGLALFITVFFGAMTAGSVVWGRVAEATTIPTALFAAAIGGALAGVLASRVRLPAGDADLSPSHHWQAPALADEIPGERGPIAVQVEYRVRRADRAAFLAALGDFSAERLRNGGYAWHVLEDAEDPERFRELFFEPSWLDHLRHHTRVTMADAALQARGEAYHVGPEPPKVSHWLAASADDASRAAPLPEEERGVA